MQRQLVAWVLLGAIVSSAAAYTPRVNYQLQCMGCHRGDGTGEAGRVPNVRPTLVPFSALPEGRDFMLRVPGVAQAKLSDADIAALLNWMARNLSDVPVGGDFVDYTADEVARARHRPLPAVQQQRAALLARVGQ